MEALSALQLPGSSCCKAYFKDYNLNEICRDKSWKFPCFVSNTFRNPMGPAQRFLGEITEGKSQVMGKYHGSSPQRRLTKSIHKEYNKSLTFQFKEVYIFRAKPQVTYMDIFSQSNLIWEPGDFT